MERGRFLWPSPADGAVTITPAQLGYLLEGIELTLRVRFAQAHAAADLATDGGRLRSCFASAAGSDSLGGMTIAPLPTANRLST